MVLDRDIIVSIMVHLKSKRIIFLIMHQQRGSLAEFRFPFVLFQLVDTYIVMKGAMYVS